MSLQLSQIEYSELNARQKENYNFLKVSAVLADYGFITMRLSDDWQGADFIAQHIDGKQFLKVQLKSRLCFYEKYCGKDLYIAFCSQAQWYLYPHDELLEQIRKITGITATASWLEHGGYSFPEISHQIKELLGQYKIPILASAVEVAT